MSSEHSSREATRQEPALGWRLWRLRDGLLQSCAVGYVWRPGANEACCLGMHSCPVAPGRGCACGLWALFSFLGCIDRARNEPRERNWALGLIQAWGEVALHGREGFRAQHASVACLLTDWPWEGVGLAPARNQFSVFVHRALQMMGCRVDPIQPDPGRSPSLRRAAAYYGVPLLSLRDALDCRLLEEFGLGEPARREAGLWVEAAGGRRLRRPA
jgi:hypothetical protein